AEVVDVIQHHLLQLTDPGVEVAGNGDVNDQQGAVAARPLDAGEAVEGHDRLVGGGGADDDVGLDQGVVEPVEGDDAADPLVGDGAGPHDVAIGDKDCTGTQGPEVLNGKLHHLVGADEHDVLIGKVCDDDAS